MVMPFRRFRRRLAANLAASLDEDEYWPGRGVLGRERQVEEDSFWKSSLTQERQLRASQEVRPLGAYASGYRLLMGRDKISVHRTEGSWQESFTDVETDIDAQHETKASSSGKLP